MGAVMGVCGGLGSFRGGYGVARVAVVGPCVEFVGPFGGRLWGPVWRFVVLWGMVMGLFGAVMWSCVEVWRFGGWLWGYLGAVMGPCVEVWRSGGRL